MDNTKTPEVLAIVPLPSATERRRRERLLARVMLVAIDIFVDRFLRKIVELVVPTFVAHDRSVEGAGAEPIFPLLGEQAVELFGPGIER